MATYFMGATSSSNTNAYVIDDRYFSSVARGNDGDNTIDIMPGNDVEDGTQESLFQTAISNLGVTSIRWPGGTEAERGLDLVSDGNSDVFDWLSENSSDPNLDVADLKAVIDYCAANSLNLSFTFPTEFFNGMSESQINTYEAGIKAFIQNDLLGYAQSKGVTVDSIKIGNEYNLNNLTATEYGKIASRLTQFIGEEVAAFGVAHPSLEQPDITIESGPIWLTEFTGTDTFFGDGNGAIGGWHQDVDQIIAEFNATESQYVTAIDIHDLTLRIQSYDDYFGLAANRSSLNAVYQSLNDFDGWTNAFGNDVELHSLAWTTQGANGAALAGASMAFLQFYEMSLAGVSYASNFLASGAAYKQTLVNKDDSDLRAGGEVFRMMNDNLQGLKAVEFGTDPSVYENDADVEDVVFRAFEKEGQIVLYVGNLENSNQTITMKQVYAFLSSAEGFSGIANLNDRDDLHIWGTILGTAGSATDHTADAELEILNADDIVSSNWKLEFDLDAHEIMQLVFTTQSAGGVTMRGHEQNDVLQGSSWADIFYGGAGNDIIEGGDGNDKINGGTGDDKLYDGHGNDTLRGGSGNDELYFGTGASSQSGSGTDKAYGDDGADLFVFSGTSGFTAIMDFQDGVDQIHFNGSDVESMSDLTITDQPWRDSVKIQYGGGVIRIEDTSISDISAADFIF